MATKRKPTKKLTSFRDRVIGLQKVRASDLQPSPKNWRTHGDEQRGALEGLLRQVGFVAPVLARKTKSGKLQLFDGHLRRDMAMDAEVPVIVTDLSEKEADLLLASMDPLSAMAGRNDEALKSLLGGLSTSEDAVRTLLDNLLSAVVDVAADGGTDPDDVPGLSSDPYVRLGHAYQLGAHRIVCGDSTDPAVVTQALAGAAPPSLMMTDPPYGVEYDPEWRDGLGIVAGRSKGKVRNDDRIDWSAAFKLYPGPVAYVWHAGIYAVEVGQSLTASEFEIRSQIIWAKQNFPISRGAYHWKHEPCWYAVRKGAKASWRGGRKQTTLWEIQTAGGFGKSGDEADAATGHGTQKPVELYQRAINNHTKAGDVIYEPFSGSGTAIIAAERLGRRCSAIELDPSYVQVAIERWERFTGRKSESAD